MQFAYCKGRSTKVAILTLLHRLYQHLDRPRTYARILFIDFSSAFNTIQPHMLIEKLPGMEVNPTLICWVHDFLVDREQRVRVGMTLSDILTTNTGASQRCILSPVLFTLYTAYCGSEDGENLLIKFADDTSLSDFLEGDEAGYREAVTKLVNRRERNFLDFNISKTKEIIVD